MKPTDAIWTELGAADKKAQEEFESKTVAFNTGSRDVKIAEARQVFDKYRKTDHWKDPIFVAVPVADLAVFTNAVTFYQGCIPHVFAYDSRGEKLMVSSPGYAC